MKTVFLTTRDQAALQVLLQDSGEAGVRYEFRIHFGTDEGRIEFARCGVTPYVSFHCDPYDLEKQEAYVAALAVYAFRHLISKHGTDAVNMIENEVHTYGPQGGYMHKDFVGSLIGQYAQVTFADLMAAVEAK